MNAAERAVERLHPRLSVRLRVAKSRWGGDPLFAAIDDLVGPGDLCVDVGANRGTYTLRMLQRVGTAGRVEALEPSPGGLRVLCSLRARYPNLTVHAVAGGDAPGSGTLHVPLHRNDLIEALGSLSAPNRPHRAFEVRVDTLDRLLAARDRPVSLVKCDVEGSEQPVLQGAFGMLAAELPVLLVEIEQRHRAEPISTTFEFLERLGYAGFFFTVGSLRHLDEFDIEQHQLRFLTDQFVPYRMPDGYISDFLFADRGTDLSSLARRLRRR